MNATLLSIEENMAQIAPHRKPALFNEFLVKGYTAVTLSTVPQELRVDLLQAKLCLGTLITLYDDFADRPLQSDPQLLEILYQFNFDHIPKIRNLDPKRNCVLDFAFSLFSQMKNTLIRLPNYEKLIEVLNFDLKQFYTANQYSSLITAHPFMSNSLENRLYAHHNMGMILVAMMDLAALPNIHFSELGKIRQVFLIGQRLGRIFNVLSTQKREESEGDITGELSAEETKFGHKRLQIETIALFKKLEHFDSQIKTFSVSSYADGLRQVQSLHKRMEGTI